MPDPWHPPLELLVQDAHHELLGLQEGGVPPSVNAHRRPFRHTSTNGLPSPQLHPHPHPYTHTLPPTAHQLPHLSSPQLLRPKDEAVLPTNLLSTTVEPITDTAHHCTAHDGTID